MIMLHLTTTPQQPHALSVTRTARPRHQCFFHFCKTAIHLMLLGTVLPNQKLCSPPRHTWLPTRRPPPRPQGRSEPLPPGPQGWGAAAGRPLGATEAARAGEDGGTTSTRGCPRHARADAGDPTPICAPARPRRTAAACWSASCASRAAPWRSAPSTWATSWPPCRAGCRKRAVRCGAWRAGPGWQQTACSCPPEAGKARVAHPQQCWPRAAALPAPPGGLLHDTATPGGLTQAGHNNVSIQMYTNVSCIRH